MIAALAIGAALAGAQPASAPAAVPVVEAPDLQATANAIENGRLEQAELMLGKAISAGMSGPIIDRLSADLAFSSERNAEALGTYKKLIAAGDHSGLVSERAGIAALKLGKFNEGLALIDAATKASGTTWRTWNARGVIADRQGDWAIADSSYAQADAMAPGHPEVANNLGWSQVLRGNWAAAAEQFSRAAAMGGTSARIRNNLELARAALASELPQRKPNESDASWAARLNDAGVAAQIMGDQRRAIAAFTRALEASGRWYERAANNLQATTAAR